MLESNWFTKVRDTTLLLSLSKEKLKYLKSAPPNPHALLTLL